MKGEFKDMNIMNKAMFVAAPLLLAIPLMGMRCSGMQYKASAECKTGNGCTVRGEVGGTIPFAPVKRSFVESVLAAANPPDAAQFHLDVSNSTVTVPATGLVTVELWDSSTGQTQASKVFPWKRTGTNLALKYPNAVNSWATQSGGTADSVRYQLHPFQTGNQGATNTLGGTAVYENEVQAAFNTTWRGQICPNDPIRHCE